MRLDHVIPTLITGGAQHFVVDLSIAAQEAGHSVRILTFSDEESIPSKRARKSGIEVVALGASARDPRAMGRLSKATIESDIVHVHLFPALYFAAFAIGGRPLVYTEHSTHNRRREFPWLRTIERAVYEKYDRVAAISDGVARALLEYFTRIGVKQTIETIPNGINPEYFQAPRQVLPHERPLRILAVGTLDDRKNFELAIDAMRNVGGATLSIVGDGPLMPKLRKQVIDEGLEHRVSLLGARSDVRDQLDRSHVLLSTSKFEGFGLVAAEAMARGCLVVGPDIAGFNEVVRDGRTGVLYPQSKNASEAISERLRILCEDAAAYCRLASNALAESRQFDISGSFRRYLSMYESVLNSAH